MNCVKADKLSLYLDQLLPEFEQEQIEEHLKVCKDCKELLNMLVDEDQFIKETLQTPTLPDDFASIVLDKLEPYGQKKNTRKRGSTWNRALLTAAGVALAFGLTTAISPSFAQLIGGMFGQEVVDDGLKRATEAGLGERVNLEVTDSGLTLKVEDIVTDSARVALSYQVLNKNSKPQDPLLREWEGKGNKVKLFDQNGKELEHLSSSYTNGEDYGLLEYSLREFTGLEVVTIKFELAELAGKRGNWQLEVPVDLKENSKLTKKVPLQEAQISANGVHVNLKDAIFAPSSNELFYETSFTKEELAKVEKQIQVLNNKLGEEFVKQFNGSYQTAIGYTIENDNKEPIFKHRSFIEEKGHPIDLGGLRGTGNWLDELGKVGWNDSFIPQAGDGNLTFVLEGVFKTVPVDYSIKIQPSELKNKPVSFEFEGNYITVKEAKIHNDYSLHKSLMPIEKQTAFQIEMEGSRDQMASELLDWVLVDDKGEVYNSSRSSSILDEKDENNRFKTTLSLQVHELEEVPEEVTLHLISVTRYEKLDNPWRVSVSK